MTLLPQQRPPDTRTHAEKLARLKEVQSTKIYKMVRAKFAVLIQAFQARRTTHIPGEEMTPREYARQYYVLVGWL